MLKWMVGVSLFVSVIGSVFWAFQIGIKALLLAPLHSIGVFLILSIPVLSAAIAGAMFAWKPDRVRK